MLSQCILIFFFSFNALFWSWLPLPLTSVKRFPLNFKDNWISYQVFVLERDAIKKSHADPIGLEPRMTKCACSSAAVAL